VPEEGIVFEELEKELLKKAMEKANNVAAKAARLLGMSYKPSGTGGRNSAGRFFPKKGGSSLNRNLQFAVSPLRRVPSRNSSIPNIIFS